MELHILLFTIYLFIKDLDYLLVLTIGMQKDLEKLIEKLEEDDDVQNVYTTMR